MKKRVTAFPSAKQDRVAVLLAAGSSIKDAGTEAGASTRIIYTCLDDPMFERLISRYRSKLIAETLGKLAAIACKAVAALEVALESDSDSVKVRAADSILSHLVRIREHSELAERLTELEGRLPGHAQH
jgi:hypothetical protein